MTDEQKKILASVGFGAAMLIVAIIKVVSMFGGDTNENVDKNYQAEVMEQVQQEQKANGKIEIKLPTTPIEVSSLRSSGKVRNTYSITNIEYEAEYNWALEDYSTTIYISGVKTFDKDGESSNDNGPIHWKIYDQEDKSIVVDSGAVFPPELLVGEKFEKESIHTYDLKKGRKYELVLYNE